MKRYNQLTNEELLKLQESDIDFLYDLELAHKGIIPVMRPDEPKLTELDNIPYTLVYESRGNVYTTKEDAMKVLELNVYERSYSDSIGEYNVYKLQEYNYGIKEHKNYDISSILSVRKIIDCNSALTKKYEDDLRKYKAFIKDTSSIRNEINDAISYAMVELSDLNNARKLYEKHLMLADGNVEIANKFFTDAYKDNQKIIDAIIKA